MASSTPNQQSPGSHPIQQNIRQFLSNFPLKIHRPLYKNRELLGPTLYIWGPGWKTQETSFDQDCLKWQTYLKFSGIDFDVRNANEPLISPSGKLPVFIFPTGEVLVEDRLKDYVDNHKTGKVGEIIDERHQAECQAFIALADTKLRNALLYTLWCDPVYEPYAHKKYCGHYAKPLDKIIMYQAKNEAIKEMLTRKPVLIRDEV
ncbi:37126_t:CDS:2 [Gigaspora margarita]|uniref:37126_t:CDS:1 n=1 Tax=Gigaspora margarita TaxID=4874 RepID=A0ABN7UL81_GIGMA|nr:37126_t:CDS:2 [Gigaspora margarita]